MSHVRTRLAKLEALLADRGEWRAGEWDHRDNTYFTGARVYLRGNWTVWHARQFVKGEASTVLDAMREAGEALAELRAETPREVVATQRRASLAFLDSCSTGAA